MSTFQQRLARRRFFDVAWTLLLIALVLCVSAFLNPSQLIRMEESRNAKKTSSERPDSPLESTTRRLDRKARASARFQDLQHTPTGSIALGHSLFRRVEAVDTAYMLIQDDFRRAIGRFDTPEYRRRRDWDLLCQWYRKTATQRPRTFSVNEYVVAFDRFRELSEKKARTTEETQQMWNLVVTCGQRWLKIPFDEQTQEFDLNAELPDDAPERALVKIEKMKRIIDEFQRPPEAPQPEFRTPNRRTGPPARGR